MTKLYIIVDITFDYNDEIYSSVEGNGGEPIRAFKKREKAQAACRQLNFEKLRGLNLNEYCYGIDDICNDSRALYKLLHGEPEEILLESKVLDVTCKKCNKPIPYIESSFCTFCGSEITFHTVKTKKTVGHDSDDFTIPSDLSDEKLVEVLNLINIEFYKVVDIDQE